VTGTGLRPVLDALDDETRPVFVEQYRDLLRDAYPQAASGTLFPFRRIFVVARKD
jgi:trans-aconitate 2-methyltransferase